MFTQTMQQIEQVQQALPTGTITLRGLIGLAAVVLGWGGWKGLQAMKPVVQPILDDIWMGSFVRNGARVEKGLREIFAGDIAMREETHQLVQETMRTTAANAAAIAKWLERDDERMREREQKDERLVARISESVAPLAQGLNDMHGEIKYLSGQVDLIVGERNR